MAPGSEAGAGAGPPLREHDPVGHFDDETAIEPIEPGRWRTRLTGRWNIAESANGGYALSPVLRALREVAGQRDPLSVTTHFLRPVQVPPGDGEWAEVRTELVRSGRTTSVASGTLVLAGRDRLRVMATFGELDPPRPAGSASGPTPGLMSGPSIVLGPPPLPPPERCVDRRMLDQGVELPILDRLEVRIHPDRVAPDGSADAVMEGWIRFADRSAPSTSALVLFADAFPPSLYAKFGRIGWVPSVELTVHARRHPAPGWVQARFECDDLLDGRMIETGSLWDETGQLVARSRQLGLLLVR